MFGYVAFWILLEREVEFLIEKIEPGDTILVDLFGLRPIFGSRFSLLLVELFAPRFDRNVNSQERGTIQESSVTRPCTKISATMKFRHELWEISTEIERDFFSE